MIAMGASGLITAPPGGKKTWFSFSFLAGIRIIRLVTKVHGITEMVERGSPGLRIMHKVFIFLSFVYTTAMLMLVCERLEVPKDENEDGATWGVFGSILFVVSTLSTVGDTTLSPASILGRFFAVWIVLFNFYVQGPKVLALVLDFLSGRNLGLGTYTGTEHIVVCGSPSAPMLWDFLYEVYHLNHYESGDQFDREAPDIVLLIPSRTTLRHMHEFLERRDSLLFRERVIALHGEPSDPDAANRARLKYAREIVVLPNMTTADSSGDDGMNIMRAYAISSSVPHVPCTCLLHTLEQRPTDFVFHEGKSTFISIEAFKLSLLAKACLVPGFMCCICNLCKTVGETDTPGEAWQNEYEAGLCTELYEVRLSEVYHGLTFHEVATDILARSALGNVYLIGLNETYVDEKGKQCNRLQIHPGAEYLIKNIQYDVHGVFIAGEISDIVQKEATGEHSLQPLQRKGKKKLRRSMDSNSSMGTCSTDDDDVDYSPRSPADPERTDRQKFVPSAATQKFDVPQRRKGAEAIEDVPAFDISKLRPPVISAEERAKQNALQGYEKAMTKIGHKLLASGVDMGIVGEICRDPDEPRKKDKQAIAPGASPWTSKAPQVQPLRALADDTNANLQPRVEQYAVDTYDQDDVRFARVKRCHMIQERMESDLKHPPDPPESLLKNGGHLLLCVVTSTSSETNTEVAVGDFGPPIGISHFVRPLRTPGIGQAQPVLIVLAEELPSDWHAVAEDPHIFFVTGSPLNVNDLDRAGFRTCNAIAVARCHQAACTTNTLKIADSRAILATTIIEAQFRTRAPPPVVTDCAYDASVDFLPMSHTMQLAISHIKGRPPKRSGGGGTNFLELPALSGQTKDTRAKLISAQKSLGETAFEEDYEVLTAPDYAEHPRYICGTVFVVGAMTALLANTMHNRTLVGLISKLLEAPFLLLYVPAAWQGQSYADLCDWLMKARNLLPLGIYRNSSCTQDSGSDSANKPSLYYMFTAPPAYKTIMIRSDRVLCIAPKEED
jgi:hypothetical protein